MYVSAVGSCICVIGNGNVRYIIVFSCTFTTLLLISASSKTHIIFRSRLLFLVVPCCSG